MKKRLKSLLALCMAGIMMFAMTTGIASAGETVSNDTQKYNIIEYIDIGKPGTQNAFYPGDIITPNSTGEESGIKVHEFFVAKYYEKNELEGPYLETLNTHVFTPGYMGSDELQGVYRYWAKGNDYAVLCNYTTGEGWSVVEDKNIIKVMNDVMSKYSFNEYILDTDNSYYESKYLSGGWPYKFDDDHSSYPYYSFTYGETDNYGTRALKLPPVNKLFGDDYEFGYHYSLQKIEKSLWDFEKFPANPDNLPSGIAPVKDTGTNKLIDTIFGGKQEEQSADLYGCFTFNNALVIEAVANEYTVNYDTNGGTPSTVASKTDVKWGDKVLPDSNPTKEGHFFNGWQCVKVGDTDVTPINVGEKTTYGNIMEAYADQTGTSINDRIESITLQAQWIKDGEYQVIYDTKGGTPDSIIKSDVKWADEVLDKIKDTIISKTGYTFQKWMCDETEVSDATTYGALAIEKTVKSITLEAQWIANTYTVKFDANGGSGEMATQTLTYDKEEALNANEFTRTGYTFTGWNTKADGTGTPSYIDKEEVKNLTEKANGKVTLYAQWTANDYTVKYDTNGGSAVADKTVKWEDNVLADVEDPTKDGFTFKGWKCGEAEVTADTTYSDLAENDKVADLTLTAQWEEIVVPADEPTTPDDTSSTGDNMNITLLMALLLLSGCGIAGAGLYRRNHVK